MVSAVVQSATYVPLFLWYDLASSVSLVTGASVVPPDAIPAAGAVDVYYIGSVDGDVWKLALGGRAPEKLCLLGSSSRDDRLFFEATSPRHWVLRGHVGEGGQAQAGVGLVADVEGRAATRRDASTEPEPGTWSSFGSPVDLRDPASVLRSFWTGFWPIEGLVVSGSTGRDRIRLSLETPFVAWAIRNVTVLPGDQLVFQLGDDQVCLLDSGRMRLAVVARGRGPAVVLR